MAATVLATGARTRYLAAPVSGAVSAGLAEALGMLGLSRHNAIGTGDAENDRSLLDACEVGYLHPGRWQLTLGTDERGEAVTVPASQLNIVICGGTRDGKSYLAGLLLEQVIQPG